MPTQQQIDAFLDAAAANAVPRLKALLRAGVPVNARNNSHKTALWSAAKAGAEAAFDYLLSRGADPAVRHPEHGWTPLQDAAGAATPAHERICQKLLASALGKDKAAVQGAMLAACCSGTAAIVKALVDAGADVNKRERFGGSYLLSAIRDNDLRDQVVPILLAAGADLALRRPRQQFDSPDEKKLIGKTAGQIARALGYQALAGLLASAWAARPKSAPKPEPKPPRTVDEAWDRIEAWLKANAPKWKPLLRGASDAQVARAEKDLGVKLPADVKASYRRHNGTDDHGFFPDHAGDDVSWYLLPLSAMVGEAEEWAELLDDGDFDDSKPKAGRGVRREAWNTKWVPFAGNGGGDCWCLDFAPAAGGKRGQVIYVSHEMAPREVLARSFREWLGGFAVALEAGAYRYEEGERLVPR
jgi:cell wall assembly regulator SMI1